MEISDYGYDGDWGSSNELGIFFYGERVFDGWDQNDGIRSYQFRLRLENGF